ncbi:MAG TPA: ABC-F family ATP-binding cassette domain-containing protein [Verrucomicrobiae bacterium]|nr:ABC-F family ATP-binding cassette domain-containing protein [Verrucomicrobiae bacterium]
MLTLTQIGKRYGARVLFEDVSLAVNSGDRVAVVGPNGAGKSTLCSIILGHETPDSGTVALDRRASVGYLPQETFASSDESVLDLAIGVSPELVTLRGILTACERRGDTEGAAYHEAHTRYVELGGFGLEPKAKRVLKGLAFRESDFSRSARELSGGWVMRAHMARLLVMEPDLLMLDEPTNHLDLESLVWFQSYLASYPGAILMISHDRAFLNGLADTVVEIRGGRMRRYRGNYDSYLEQRAAREEQLIAAYKNQQAEIARLQRFVDRFGAKNTKATQAKSKAKQIERMEKIDAPEEEDRVIRIRFPQPPRSGLKVVALKGVHHAYGDAVVYRGIDYAAERGQRTVFVGPNGAGKSTLLKILAGVLPVQRGTRTLGHNVVVGYYSQNRVETLDPANTVLEEVQGIARPVPEVEARTVLGSFLFRRDDVFKRVGVLSGGEKSRLALVKLLLDPPNLLLMDEPTTHLDMASIDALIHALGQYKGTLLFISHDVYFIRSLATSVLHVSGGELRPYPGGYDYYLDRVGSASARAGLIAGGGARDGAVGGVGATAGGGKETGRERRRREAAERQVRSMARKGAQDELHRVEGEIMRLEARQKELAGILAQPETYQAGTDVVGINRELGTITARLVELGAEWHLAAEAVENLG